MNTDRMATITHINVLSTYLADWSMKIQLLPYAKDPAAQIKGYTNLFRAVSVGERDINTLLRLIDERLQFLETRPLLSLENTKTFDFIADFEVIVFLKALYVQIRIYLDTISGAIRHFNKKLNLPKNFNKLLMKVGTPAIPQNLTQVLLPAITWFKYLKNTRDDLVHNYEDFMVLINGSTVHHASLSKISGNKVFDYGAIKLSVGELLKNIQVMIDHLLDYFDDNFFDWYGFVQSTNSRNRTIYEGGYLWYWAYKYGGYSHKEFQVRDEKIDE